MNVFISWSGEQSRYIALALRDWLPSVIQAIEPWLSESDLRKGTRWSPELAAKLDEANFGICCLTPNALNAPWLLFEAGAISKKVHESSLWTYLYGLDHNDVKYPLAMFNHTKASREDTKKLMHSINGAMQKAKDKPLKDTALDNAFDVYWPVLEKKLENVPPEPSTLSPKRSIEDKVEEVLTLARELVRRDESARLRAVRIEELRRLARQIAARDDGGSDFPDEGPDEGPDEDPDEGPDEDPDEGPDEDPDEGPDEDPDGGPDEDPDGERPDEP